MVSPMIQQFELSHYYWNYTVLANNVHIASFSMLGMLIDRLQIKHATGDLYERKFHIHLTEYLLLYKVHQLRCV